MDLHVPEAPIRSIKDFLIHIVIVTIGILIALGLEQLVESRHRAHLAAEAVDGFKKEITADLSEIAELRSRLPHQREQVATLIAELSGPPKTIVYPGVHYYPLSTASWNAALATQALSELSFEEVHRYAMAYDQLRLFLDIERSSLAAWQEMHAFGTDPAKLDAEQRRALLEKLNNYGSLTETIELVAAKTVEDCQAALK